MERHAEGVFRESLAKSGLSAADVEVAVAQQEGLKAEGGRGWSAFWASLDFPMTPELTPCVEAGLLLDKMLSAVEQAIKNEEPNDARAAFCDFISAWGLPPEAFSDAEPGLARADWLEARTWEEVVRLARPLLNAAYFDQFAYADAVWGNLFFTRFQPRPVFSLIGPKLRDGGGLKMPVRRLLEFSWAVNHWARFRTWPAKPPGPTTLAEPLGLHPSDVSNLFDGTAQLRYEQFKPRWDRFAMHFRLPQEIACPMPMAAVAICWQRHLVPVTAEHKLRSAPIVLDSRYQNLWRWRRSTLTAPGFGTESWAAWLED